MTATNAANDWTLVTYEMTATADATGWHILYPNHAMPIALHVRIDADSVIMDAGPYASTARNGATVTIHGVLHVRERKLVGTESAYYKSTPPSPWRTSNWKVREAGDIDVPCRRCRRRCDRSFSTSS